MINYTYDGSFEGLLTAIFEAYYRHENPQSIYSPQRSLQLFMGETINIATDENKASRVYDAIYRKISVNCLQNIYYAFLSQISDIEISIFQYIKLGFTEGKKVDLYLSNPLVLKIHNAVQRVKKESHLMNGLIRFKEIGNNLYYASYSPQFNITEIISPHFASRFSNQNWIIHDVTRKIASMYNKISFTLFDVDSNFNLESITRKDIYESLWIDYFDNICIKERINPELQKRFMPKRYWKHLIEKQKDL